MLGKHDDAWAIRCAVRGRAGEREMGDDQQTARRVASRGRLLAQPTLPGFCIWARPRLISKSPGWSFPLPSPSPRPPCLLAPVSLLLVAVIDSI